MRWRHLVIVLLAAVATGGWWAAWKERRARGAQDIFDARRLALLTSENERLTRALVQQRTAGELASDATQRVEIEQAVTSLRDLPFTTKVTYRQIPRAELPDILRKKLFQQMPDHEFDAEGVALSALGLLPPGTDLKKTYLALLGEQIGAFYDQHTREVFTFSGQPLSSAQNRVILAHELTHALEDQHFRLESLPLEAKGNDDRTMAASALVEGDATLVMNRYMVGQLSGAVIKESLASALTTDIRQLATAPRFLRETLLFPYLKGQVFCDTLFTQGGWPALAEAFRRPPSCTAQILHPERFLRQPRWEPEPIKFAATQARGQTPLVDNVVGEFGLGQLLRTWLKNDTAGELASEWCGDRFLVYGNDRANSYLWCSRWSSQEAAERFATAAVSGWTSRYGQKPEDVPSPLGASGGHPNGHQSFARLPDARELRVIQDGRAVNLIVAQDKSWMEALTGLIPPSSSERIANDESTR